MDAGRVAGWLATVSRGGDLVWVGRGGYRDRETGLPVVDDTVWRIYSMTKPVVALLVMSLFEEGLFDLNDDVARWIPELAEPRVFVGGTAEAPETVAADGPVRVHHLLSHTSGLTYGFQRRHVVDEIYRHKGYDFVWAAQRDLAGCVADWCSSPLVFEPGTRFNYSVSFDVLGRTGRALDRPGIRRGAGRARARPPGLSHTGWWCPEDQHDRLARLYLVTADGAAPFDQLGHHAQREPHVLGGGGGLVSTAADYERLTRLFLNGGELDGVRVVSRPTLGLMMRNQLPGRSDLVASAVDSYAEAAYAGLGFGYGGFVVEDAAVNRGPTTEGSYGVGRGGLDDLLGGPRRGPGGRLLPPAVPDRVDPDPPRVRPARLRGDHRLIAQTLRLRPSISEASGRGTAGEYRNPWPKSQCSSRRRSSWSVVSMPSATIVTPSRLPRVMMASSSASLCSLSTAGLTKQPVDLDDPRVQAHQVRQRGVSGAEVVERDPDAALGQPREAPPTSRLTSRIVALSVISTIRRSGAESALLQRVIDDRDVKPGSRN